MQTKPTVILPPAIPTERRVNLDNAQHIYTYYPSAFLKGLTFETYVFPKALKELVTYHIAAAKFDADKPITIRTLLESLTLLHLQIGAVPNLDGFDHEFGLTLDRVLAKVKDWSNTNPRTLDISQAQKFKDMVTPELLNILEDRIRFLPIEKKPLIERAEEKTTATHVWFYHTCDSGSIHDLRKLGINYRAVLSEFIEFIETHGGVGTDPVQFILNHFWIVINPDGIGLALNRLDVYSNLAQTLRRVRGGSFLVKLEEQIFALKTIYFSRYSQWVDSGTNVDIDGANIYVSHHTVFDETRFDAGTLMHHPNPLYRNKLPFGTHPKHYCAELIQVIAHQMFKEASEDYTPKEKVLDTVIGGRQLITGVDLVNEGNVMKHCVGGEDYRESMTKGTQIFFHVDVPGFPKGATLSMRLTTRGVGQCVFNNQYWLVTQYYGFDDEEIFNEETDFAIAAEKALDEFLAQNDLIVPAWFIRGIYRSFVPVHEIKIPFRQSNYNLFGDCYNRVAKEDPSFDAKRALAYTRNSMFGNASHFNSSLGGWDIDAIPTRNPFLDHDHLQHLLRSNRDYSLSAEARRLEEEARIMQEICQRRVVVSTNDPEQRDFYNAWCKELREVNAPHGVSQTELAASISQQENAIDALSNAFEHTIAFRAKAFGDEINQFAAQISKPSE